MWKRISRLESPCKRIIIKIGTRETSVVVVPLVQDTSRDTTAVCIILWCGSPGLGRPEDLSDLAHEPKWSASMCKSGAPLYMNSLHTIIITIMQQRLRRRLSHGLYPANCLIYRYIPALPIYWYKPARSVETGFPDNLASHTYLK